MSSTPLNDATLDDDRDTWETMIIPRDPGDILVLQGEVDHILNRAKPLNKP